MKIKSQGYTAFKLSFKEIDVVTDPVLAIEAGAPSLKTEADVVIYTPKKYIGNGDVLVESGLDEKYSPSSRESIMQLASPGDYEVGGVIFRRALDSDFFVMDEGDIRIVYFGETTKKNVDPDEISRLGDVDVLIMPVGDVDGFPSYEKLDDTIKRIDPTYLVPSAYKDGKTGEKVEGLKTVEEFVKKFGFTHVKEEKTLKVTKGGTVDEKVMEVVVLK